MVMTGRGVCVCGGGGASEVLPLSLSHMLKGGGAQKSVHPLKETQSADFDKHYQYVTYIDV